MRAFSISRLINPFYAFVAGSLGFFAMLLMLTWNYPLPGDLVGQAFVRAQPFVIWAFLLGVYGCLLTILVLPLWGMLARLVKSRLDGLDARSTWQTLGLLALQAVVLTVVVYLLLRITTMAQVGFDFAAFVPRGHSLRMSFLFLYTFVTALPALLGILLVHTGAQEVSQKIEAAGRSTGKLFPLIDEVLTLRSHLQNYLAVLGLILSMIPINTAGLRAILVALDAANEQAFPVTYAIIYGLTFTLILLLIYIPAHLVLSDTSRRLRDHLRPLESMDSLKPDLEQRKALDELLQTNIGVSQNLKAGLITLAPLFASLVSSLFNVSLHL